MDQSPNPKVLIFHSFHIGSEITISLFSDSADVVWSELRDQIQQNNEPPYFNYAVIFLISLKFQIPLVFTLQSWRYYEKN